MERLSAFPSNQEQGEAKPEVASKEKEAAKQDESRSCATVASAATLKRPLSAAASLASSTRSNQVIPTNLARQAIGLKRPKSAFSGLRPKFHRPDDSKMALSQKSSGSFDRKGRI